MSCRASLIVLSLMFAIPTNILAQKDRSAKLKQEEIVTRATVKPSFPEGNQALFNYIAKHLNSSKKEITKTANKKTIISFVVEKDGQITDIQIVHSLSKSLDRKIKRVIRKMPRWNPASTNGEPVRFRFHLPIIATKKPRK